ncbi:hypothetical protein BC835DRAFT_1408672 [Cytidiella melzeri]|nr:hypothetical protein BC835DRAFT_1408672 [Cytidiella melzeri]
MPTSLASNGSESTQALRKPTQRTKKSRLVKRRGRVQTGSDDEIEREARSDSDSDDQSSLDSESDSETASDDEHHAGIVTPSTTQSPPPLDINGSSSSVKPEPIVTSGSGPFVGPTDWAQIVADENETGGDDLPVIDFADMHTHAISEPTRPPPRSRKAQKQAKKASVVRSAQEPVEPAKSDEQQVHESDNEPLASTSHTAAKEPSLSKVRGQSVRQAYQERLQQDPAFVPRVGEFWGHDDRLLDKDLRSLSGWWRGRWHNRGRGRGPFTMRGRGRGFFPGRVPLHEDNHDAAAGNTAAPLEDVPPIERAWTHDGFEEMKRREEHRRPQVQAPPQSPASQRGNAFRGRGTFGSGRGRGGTAPSGRPASPVKSTSALHPQSHSEPSTKRPWFAMKPEKMWTKNADTFLYMEAAPRLRQRQSGVVRIKLPGRTAQVLRPQKPAHFAESATSTPGPTASSSTTLSADDAERHFVVRFPTTGLKTAGKTPYVAGRAAAEPASTSSTAVSELSIEEVFTVRPHAVPSHIPIDVTNKDSSPSLPATAQLAVSPPLEVSALPDSSIQRQLEQFGLGIGGTAASNDTPSAILEETLLRNPPPDEINGSIPQSSDDQTRQAPPPLHSLQTSFSPVPPTSPPYGSPYSYGPTMPPGIAMSQQGYPYEVSTGRPVYLQHPPQPMYAPQPMLHPYMGRAPPGIPFVPGHMSHPSQDFAPHTHTPVNGFMDPTSGVPIFSPARQNSRIEIRAPTERLDGTTAKPAPRSSGLRTSITESEPAQLAGVTNEDAEATQSARVHPVADQPPMMAYAPYPHQYYYPDPNAYSAYMDMSPQMHYELYPPHDPRAHQPHQPIIYY